MHDPANDNRPIAPGKIETTAFRPCPICKRPATITYQPFCSKRCADVDLHRWLGGTYVVEGIEPPEIMEGDKADM